VIGAAAKVTALVRSTTQTALDDPLCAQFTPTAPPAVPILRDKKSPQLARRKVVFMQTQRRLLHLMIIGNRCDVGPCVQFKQHRRAS
jgi:hypothetical protein